MQRVAQDWIVLTQLTHPDATAVGIVTGLQFAPQLLLLPWTGLAADRFSQRKLLMLTQASMGVLATALGILTISVYVRLWHVYVFAFVFGALRRSGAGCASAANLCWKLVGDEHLPNAVALNSTSFFAGQMIGTGWAFLLNGLSFGAVLLSMYLLRVRELRPSARASRAAGAFIEGLRFVWARPDLRSILVVALSDRHIRSEFPDLHLHHGGECLPCRCADSVCCRRSWRSAQLAERFWRPDATSQSLGRCSSAPESLESVVRLLRSLLDTGGLLRPSR